jgi:hypothetical protein
MSKIRAFKFESQFVVGWGVIESFYTKSDFVPVLKVLRWKFSPSNICHATNNSQDNNEKSQYKHDNRLCTKHRNRMFHTKIKSFQQEAQNEVKKDTGNNMLEEMDSVQDACSHHILCLILNDNTKRYIDYSYSVFQSSKKDIAKLSPKVQEFYKQAETHVPVLYCKTEQELEEFGLRLKPNTEMTKLVCVEQYLNFIETQYPEKIEAFVIMMRSLVRSMLGHLPNKITPREAKLIYVRELHTEIWSQIEKLKTEHKQKSQETQIL